VTEYRVNIDLAKAAARVPGWERASFKEFAQSLGTSTIPVNVWVDDDGTSIPVLPQGPGSQQWLVTTEEAGHWYVDLDSTSDFAFSAACH
jgi:hypothetical protein